MMHCAWKYTIAYRQGPRDVVQPVSSEKLRPRAHDWSTMVDQAKKVGDMV